MEYGWKKNCEKKTKFLQIDRIIRHTRVVFDQPTCIYWLLFHFWKYFLGIFYNMENIRPDQFYLRQLAALSHIRSSNVRSLIWWHWKWILIVINCFVRNSFQALEKKTYVKNSLATSPRNPKCSIVFLEWISQIVRSKQEWPSTPKVDKKSSAMPYNIARSPPWNACLCCSGRVGALFDVIVIKSAPFSSSIERVLRDVK